MSGKRIEREKKVVSKMIHIYCRAHHGKPTDGLCDECRQLAEFALARLDNCRKGENKPTCRKCTTHCYAPAKREAIRIVMRYAGPRMLWHHPVAAIRHLIDETFTS